MIIASKGAAGVTGAGLATLAGGLASHRPELVDGVGLIVGIDRFMSEARAVTNFAGNAVATLVIGTWTHSVDHDQVTLVLAGGDPFNEETMVDDGHGHGDEVEDREPELARRRALTWRPPRSRTPLPPARRPLSPLAPPPRRGREVTRGGRQRVSGGIRGRRRPPRRSSVLIGPRRS